MRDLARKWKKVGALLTGWAVMLALGSPMIAGQKPGGFQAALIIYGETAAKGEIHAAHELAKDLEKVYGFSAPVVSVPDWKKFSRPAPAASAIFYVGTAESHSLIRGFADRGVISVSAQNPGPEAFVIRSLPLSGEVIIAGCDERGTLYGVYDFSEKVLGIDALEFWTGRKPARKTRLEIPELAIRENPPAFKLRGYFDNDSDMLANFSGRKLVIEFELWKEMIDSLARMRYNFIDPFDTMGRTEFWAWPYYREKFPGYHADLELANRIIDYAHEKGMLVQLSTYLGWEFYHLPYQQKCLSVHHDDWMAAYQYLLENTPVGRADIYYHSPRDPWWDRPYKCNYEKLMGVDRGKLHSRLINELHQLIQAKNPDAQMFCLFWSDGKEQWQNGSFRPEPGIKMVWADNGYAVFPDWPEDQKGYPFGIYIHAGFWRNQVMQDPYPERIQKETLEAYRRGMTGYYFVNGQDFKHFILNLEAAGKAAWDPQGFDPQKFYPAWAGRYFGSEAAAATVESLKALHRASELAGGFANLTIETTTALALMKYGVPYLRDYAYVKPALEAAEQSLKLAEQAAALVPAEDRLVFDDQVLFPARIYLANLRLHASVAGIIEAEAQILDPLTPISKKIEAIKKIPDLKKQAPQELDRLLELLEQGSGWDKWDGWTRPGNFRKYQPPPTPQELQAALRMTLF